MGKKLKVLPVRLSEEDERELAAAARASGMPLSTYIRCRALGAALGVKPPANDVKPVKTPPPGPSVPFSMAVYDVDDLGSDPLRQDHGESVR
jgi:hypothetical protein